MASHRISSHGQDYQIVVLETTEKRRQASARILTAMIVPNLAVVLATLLAVIFGVRQGLLPLRAVERDIAGRSANDLHEIELSGTPSEIRPMLGRLNELFAQGERIGGRSATVYCRCSPSVAYAPGGVTDSIGFGQCRGCVQR